MASVDLDHVTDGADRGCTLRTYWQGETHAARANPAEAETFTMKPLGSRSPCSTRLARTFLRLSTQQPSPAPKDSTPLVKPPTNIDQLYLTAIDSEFKAMRAEIGRLIDHQRDLQN